MTGDFLLIAGIFVLSLAMRSMDHPLVFRLGTLGFIATSFLTGWLLGGSVVLGVMLSCSWILLPWLEISTRVRALRLPADRRLESRRPPNRQLFPAFPDMTEEIEAAGFEQGNDVGWNLGAAEHFYRVFHDPVRRCEVSLCHAEQEGASFFYTVITSRTTDGRSFVTWNYPFSYSLRLPPAVRLRRFNAKGPFALILARHEQFLRAQKIALTDLRAEVDADATVAAMQDDMREQIAYNIRVGVLRRDGENFIRYTNRGLFFVWVQFLRDLIRFT